MRKLIIVLMLFSSYSFAQIIAWEMNGNVGDEVTVNATTNDARLNTSTLSRGAGIDAATLSNSFSSNKFTANGTRTDAINDNEYLEFQISSISGYGFSLSTIDANFRRSSTGPNTFVWRYSDDGLNFTDINSEFTYNGSGGSGAAQAQIDLTGINDLQNVDFGTTITIRLYGWGATSEAGTFAIGVLAGDDLAIGGEIIVPEPTNHVTNFTAMHNGATQVDLTWNDNDGAQAADGFLILANTTGTFTDPVDGTPQADDTDLSNNAGQVNVAHGGETYSFTGLTPETQYFFKIFPYTNSGIAIDYKTDGTVPTANATPTTLLLVENFDYTAGTLLTDNGWTAHSGAGTQAITVNDGGLTFTDYPSSGIGNAALVDNNGEDINRSFAEQSSGTIYFSFLVRVDGISTGYFMHLNKSTSLWAARVFIQSASGGYNFGISNTSTNEVYGSTVYSTGVTYLCIVEYDFTTEDVNLWVSSSGVPASKLDAGTPEASATGSGQSPLNAISLRQYDASQNIIVDGIRVATSWAQAPLPVELTTFTANVFDGEVNLRWETATEVDNYGFEIQRSAFSNQRPANWGKIGFVEGHGNSNSPKNYEFTDSELPNCDAVSYRLKQIDIDGAYEYSNEIEVTLENIPAKFELSQNYPNPFNPVTKIQYSIPAVIASEAKQSVNATLKVYDIIGREVAVLVNESKEAGIYEVEFDASKLSSGLYFYSLTASGKTITKKMMLLR